MAAVHFKKAIASLAAVIAAATTLQALPKVTEPERSVVFPSGNFGWKSLAAHDGYLYVYSAGDSRSAVNIYSIDGYSLSYVKSVGCEGRLSGQPAFIGDTGYFCNGHCLAVCDLTTPEHAEIVNSVAFGYPVLTAANVYAAGEMLVLSGSDGTRLYDASDPFAPTLVDFIPEQSVKAVSSKHCLVRESDSACRLYGITKTGFEKLGEVDAGIASACCFVYDKAIYEADYPSTRIHDISDPLKVVTHPFTNACLHPVLGGIHWKKLYSAVGCNLEEWDVSSPLKPKLLKNVTFPVGINEGLCAYSGRFFFIDQTMKSISAYSEKSGNAVKESESFFAPSVSEIIPDNDTARLVYKTKISSGVLTVPLTPEINPVSARLTEAYTDFTSAKITKFTSPADLPIAKRPVPAKAQFGKLTFRKDADGRIEVTDTSAKSTVALLTSGPDANFAPYRAFAITNGNVYAATDSTLDIFQLVSVTNSATAGSKTANAAVDAKFQKIKSADMLRDTSHNEEEDGRPSAIDTTESPRGAITVAGDFAFLAWTMEAADDTEFMGVVSIDVSKPEELRIVDALPLPSPPCSIIADHSTNIIYTADTLGITSVAFGTNGAMSVVTDLPVSDSELKGPQQIAFLENGTLVAACGKEGLFTAEVTESTNIATVAVFESSGFARALAVSSNTVYLCDSTRGITRFQCDAPEDAEKSRTRPLRKGAATSAFCLDDRIFATSTETELTSLSADSKLRILAEYPGAQKIRRGTGSWPIAAVPFVSADGKKKFAAIALGEGGIDICEITDRKTITPVAHLSNETFKTGVNFFSALHVSGTKLYAVDRNNGLFIIDLSTPATPRLVSELIIR